MDKPIEVMITEFKENLISVINASGLPHYIVAPIINDYARQYNVASENETRRQIKEYNASVNAKAESDAKSRKGV
jgi:hypothetical protein